MVWDSMKKESFIGQREILSEVKQHKPQEYFVYFKVWVVPNYGRRSADRERGFFDAGPKRKKSDRFA